MLAITEADAYVSPRWYASPQQVPTWLYKAVNLSGPVRVLDGAELAQHLDTLAARFESLKARSRHGPWKRLPHRAGPR